MLQFIREGGTGMLVTGVWGIVGLVMAGMFVYRPSASREGFVQGISRAVLAAGIASTVFGMISLSRAISICESMGAECRMSLFALFAEGMGEAFNNLALGFTLVAFIQLGAAFGRMRMRSTT